MYYTLKKIKSYLHVGTNSKVPLQHHLIKSPFTNFFACPAFTLLNHDL